MIKKFFLVWFAAALCATAEPWETADDFVTVLGDELRIHGSPVTFVCAAGVSLPALPAASTSEAERAAAWTNAVQTGRALAGQLARCGFNMVRLPNLVVPEGRYDAYGVQALQDAFILACKQNRIKIWAEVMYPVAILPQPGQAGLLDDPATRNSWSNAVAEAWQEGADLRLAAPWDPRIEILYQRRLREWAQAFNPQTGLRRCADPVYGIFSFSQLWWEDLTAPDRPALPDFFEAQLRENWNQWLFHHFDGNGEAVATALGGLADGESLEDNTIAWKQDATGKRRREQLLFLHNLYHAHMLRLTGPFPGYGAATLNAPRTLRNRASGTLWRLSTLQVQSTAAGAEEDLSAVRKPAKPATAASMPLAVSADEADTPAKAAQAAIRAAEAGARVLALPCGNAPSAFAPIAQAFRAAHDNPALLREVLTGDTHTLDLPNLAFGTLDTAALSTTAAPRQPSAASAPAAVTALAAAPKAAGSATNLAADAAVEQPSIPVTAIARHPAAKVLVAVCTDGRAHDSFGPHQIAEETGAEAVFLLHPAGENGRTHAPQPWVLNYMVSKAAVGNLVQVRLELTDRQTGAPHAFVLETWGGDLTKRPQTQYNREGIAAPRANPENGRHRIHADEGFCAIQYDPPLLSTAPPVAVP